jgi:ribosome-binding protein aMBF1 (putative translation factor)
MKFREWNDIKKELLEDSKTKAEYDKLETEFKIIRAILDKRIKRKMSQKDLALRINSKQSAIARLESGNYNPSIKFLEKVAKGLDCKLEIKFIPITD